MRYEMTLTPTPAEVVEAGGTIFGIIANRRWVLFLPYALLFLIFMVISWYALSRMWRLRVRGDSTGTVIIAYAIFMIALVVVTLGLSLTIPWSGKIF
jgi:hypothetical protein